ncbi:Hypothetical predicted protein [Mytilus galloprovincialis]|uniref:RZ-type domain-containing protein n=1 Tax=Mytilus galloprovincialis TaxID=29158 RepID=A0A8B6FLH1_MYTGA|nr:Hypothetical predicted protein [Mytilus galloprovincialis]
MPLFAYLCLSQCGKPATVAVCMTCGKEIGGRAYKLAADNTKWEGTDRTEMGHILGDSDHISGLFPERKLSNVSCGVLRLLTHLAMFLGSDFNLPVSVTLIELIYETIIHKITKIQERRTKVIGTEEVLQLSNNRIAKDRRLDKSQLSQLLFETSGHNIHISETSLYDNPSIWQYREHVSVEHLKLMIGRVRQTYPVLNIFLEEEHSLRPLRFVPNIMRLQKHLLQKYKRRLDKTEANNLKLKMVIEEFSKDEKSEELLECIDHFQQAWSMTKDFIQKDTFVVNKRIMQLKSGLAETVIDDDTPVSFLLPSHTDQGFLSYILLYFLLQRQNLFLEKYRQSKSIGFHARPFVQVRDITSTHMISYHPDSDLLPIVLANCNYTFQVGEGTRLEYNFATLESQLIDRFLITKSDILLDDEDAIETMVYKSDSTNSVVFLALRTTIKQDKISHVVMGQIKNEMSRLQYPDLCDHIQNVDIAINFLKSLGRIEPGSSFNDFVVDTLQLDDPCLNQKLKMSNIQSLWITLSYEKTKRLQDVSKESFDGIPSRFKEHLTDDQRKFVTTYADKLPLQRLSVLVDLLYECIVLTINTPQKDEETVDMATISLDDAISQHIYDQPYENEQHADKWLTEIIVSLKKTPKALSCL